MRLTPCEEVPVQHTAAHHVEHVETNGVILDREHAFMGVNFLAHEAEVSTQTHRLSEAMSLFLGFLTSAARWCTRTPTTSVVSIQDATVIA